MHTTPVRILLIDDEEIEFRRIQRLLKKSDLNHILEWSCDSVEGLAKISAGTCDLCLMDLQIDHQSGIDLLTSYRQAGGKIPIIMLTGESRPDVDAQALAQGANDYLIKDELSVSHLARCIRYAVKDAALLAQLHAANKRFKTDLEAAAQLQRALLPNPLVKFKGYDIRWRYQPSVNVAGDTFNYFKINDTHLGVYLIDVSGHGVPAAMFAVQLSRIILPGINYGNDNCRIEDADFMNPASLLNNLNKLFPMEKPNLKYFTIIYAVIDLASGSVRCATAGAPVPYIVNRKGEVSQRASNGVPIGLMPNSTYDVFDFVLEAGERMLVYSDGINETFNDVGEMFGKQRIEVSLAQYAHTVDAQCQRLLDEVVAWTDTSREQDDCTFLIVERNGAD